MRPFTAEEREASHLRTRLLKYVFLNNVWCRNCYSAWRSEPSREKSPPSPSPWKMVVGQYPSDSAYFQPLQGFSPSLPTPISQNSLMPLLCPVFKSWVKSRSGSKTIDSEGNAAHQGHTSIKCARARVYLESARNLLISFCHSPSFCCLRAKLHYALTLTSYRLGLFFPVGI